MRDFLRFYACEFGTPIGTMVAIADSEALYSLTFSSLDNIDRELERLRKMASFEIFRAESKPLSMIKEELSDYFSGKLSRFKTPLFPLGTAFQKKAWNALLRIPYAETRSYLEQAKSVGNEKSFRAIANANGANPLAIVIPCHRIIHSNGGLGGYRAGISRKSWLIEHEKKFSPSRSLPTTAPVPQ